MSPLQLSLFIDACTSACPFDELPSNNHMPVHQECMDELEEMGLVTSSGGLPEVRRYHSTDKGRAYLEFLCSLPLPVSSWSLPGPWNPSTETA
jgi:hypothetical protein